MMNGYVSIDCQGLNLLAESSQTITGLYDACQEAMSSGKPIVAVNCVYGTGVAMTPVNVFIVPFDGYIVATASVLQVVVTDEDAVTINNLAPADEA